MRDDDSTSKRLQVVPAGRTRRRRRPSSCSIRQSTIISRLLRPDPTTQRKETFFQWRKGKDPWMQSAMDHFLNNFVFNAEDLSLLIGGSGIEVFDIAPAETGPGRTVIDVLDVLASGLLIVRAASMQTIEGRREQHVKYRLAMWKLREINTSPNDKTWQIHLDGLLAMLQQNHHSTTKCDDKSSSNLIAARECAQSDGNGDVQKFLQSRPPMDSIEKAWLLMDLSKLKLRKLIATMDHFHVEKLRVSVKQIQRDILLVRESVPKEYHPARVSKAHSSWSSASDLPPYYRGYYEEVYSNNLLCAKWNEYRTMLLITSDFMLRSGHFLYSGTSRSNTREATALSRTMEEAVDGICASVAYYYDYSRANNIKRVTIASPNDAGKRDLVPLSMTTMDALALTWSLHCAIAMRHVIAEDQRDWMKQVLYYTGSQMRIPKAMALASASAEGFSYTDVLAGLTLLGLGILRSE
ncbi:hypothetical protein UA08_07621 [Talaromyces atroroseus]|uniref:Transcription factor domain-containing protein n=1 Tax=Talaromyces atroroseus TaxID=1441469 RepID=A0A225AS34_TALAT|nr:hypothetical protein UA08_07621 [Talaromyces atroroseus]OKL57245.1 hypothetical protein UA08_07621 [Talaromyces atroroseus]